MSNLVTFNFQSHQVRTVVINNDPWFCLGDVRKVLGIKPTAPLTELDAKGKCKTLTPTRGGNQSLSYINEPNLYRVIFRSNKPEARKFQDWVFNEVLPQLRKTGSYEVDKQQPSTPESAPNSKSTHETGTIRFSRSAITLYLVNSHCLLSVASVAQALGLDPATQEAFIRKNIDTLGRRVRAIGEVLCLSPESVSMWMGSLLKRAQTPGEKRRYGKAAESIPKRARAWAKERRQAPQVPPVPTTEARPVATTEVISRPPPTLFRPRTDHESYGEKDCLAQIHDLRAIVNAIPHDPNPYATCALIGQRLETLGHCITGMSYELRAWAYINQPLETLSGEQ